MTAQALAHCVVSAVTLCTLHTPVRSCQSWRSCCAASRTCTMRPTALNSLRTTSASSSVARPPRHMALAVSPTKQGVFGITRTTRLSAPAASWCRACRVSWLPAHSGSWTGSAADAHGRAHQQ